MTQHHTATISTIAVFTMVVILVSFSLVGNGFVYIEKRRQHYQSLISSDLSPVRAVFLSWLKMDENVLKVERKNRSLYEKIPGKEFNTKYASDDYIIVKNTDYRLLISIVDIHQRISFFHIQNFFIIIFLVLGIMFIYTRHFAQNISDLIHILNKGFRKRDYNLQVKIREEFRDEEVYKLARFYNDAYLPAKLRRIHAEEQENKKSGLSMEDLTGFTGK